MASSSHSESNESVIFVFYDLLKDDATWNFGRLPGSWWWVGHGGTSNPLYPHEDQFQGDVKDIVKIKEIIKKKMDKLVAQGVVKRYKIRRSYKP